MNSVLKNIKTTLRQLFGFDEMDIFQAKRQKPLKNQKII